LGDTGIDDKFKTVLTEIYWECEDWIYLAQDTERWQAVVNTAMNLRPV